MKNIDTEKEKFLKVVKAEKGDIKKAISNSITASLQHNKTYNDKAKNKDRKIFRKALGDCVKKIAEDYKSKIYDDDEHNDNIQKIKNCIEKQFKGKNILKENTIKIATVQKCLNVYLKHLWCMGEIETPPHCPIDSIVINKADIKINDQTPRWTRICTIEEYKKIINLINTKSKEKGYKNIAEWELEVWNKWYIENQRKTT